MNDQDRTVYDKGFIHGRIMGFTVGFVLGAVITLILLALSLLHASLQNAETYACDVGVQIQHNAVYPATVVIKLEYNVSSLGNVTYDLRC